ncbi:MAG: FAD-dependent monooxygenase [Dermatophilaceae bacterium]
MSTREADVVVVGGGIGGLASAQALARLGLKVRLLEQSAEFGEVGAGLQIAPNCTRILDQWGLLEEVKSLGVLPENIVMKDALDGAELTRLDLADVQARYGFPYMVIHRSDLHATFLRACQRTGVELVNNVKVTAYEQVEGGARAISEGRADEAEVVIAADGIRSVARGYLVQDEPQSSAYVAYRGAVPIGDVMDNEVSLKDVVVYIGPRCHFVQYPLRQGEMFNQVAVFQSPKALRGEEDWGTPDELEGAFAHTVPQIRDALKHMWRDKWWRMFDRLPIPNWVNGRVVLTGDSAHAPLQYLAQGAVMAIEDAWVLSEHIGRQGAEHIARQGPTLGVAKGTPTGVDWDTALKAFNDVRTEHTRRVLTTGRDWGELWHHDGEKRLWRNQVLRDRDIHDYSFVDWLYSRTAMTPDEEPPMFQKI